MSEHLDRLRQRREQAEAQARAYRDREIAFRMGRRLENDSEFKALDTAARTARRTLQLNRLRVAQKRRSIKTMRARIEDTNVAMKPLLDKEPSLIDACETAERTLEDYRRRIATDIDTNLE